MPKIGDLHDRYDLSESYAIKGENGSPLKIDKEAGIIYGVKLGGRFSDNCHGIPGVSEGTEYKAQAYRQALPLYEGVKVYAKHLPRKGQAAQSDRGPFEYLGVIKNARYDEAADCPRGDFHYRKSHPDAASLVEDVERGMGGFGFSHHIPPGQYVGKVINGRLVIESIKQIKSVDLVDGPATTRNLWESRTVEKTFKEILEGWVAKKSAPRKAVAAALLEDDSIPLDAPMMAVDTGENAEPDDLLLKGFKSAIDAVWGQYESGELDAASAIKAISKYIKAHAKLTAEEEPEPEPEEDDPPEPKESKEVARLRSENACLKAGVKPTPALVKALGLLESQADREALLVGYKPEPTTPAKPGATKPRSTGPGAPTRPANGKALTEQKLPTGDAFVASIRG